VVRCSVLVALGQTRHDLREVLESSASSPRGTALSQRILPARTLETFNDGATLCSRLRRRCCEQTRSAKAAPKRRRPAHMDETMTYSKRAYT
jgi:hypothetical protein